MATTRVTMPQLGESVHEGTISKWLVKPGDRVVEYEPMLEVDTDKVNAEVPAPVTGVLKEILAGEGDTVQAGSEIAVVELEGDAEAPERVEVRAEEAAPTGRAQERRRRAGPGQAMPCPRRSRQRRQTPSRGRHLSERARHPPRSGPRRSGLPPSNRFRTGAATEGEGRPWPRRDGRSRSQSRRRPRRMTAVTPAVTPATATLPR
jgi:pyruvate/2-oxoglutarate dehydrogenase complex dihydrolipoamide acyltransferase (E2) component